MIIGKYFKFDAAHRLRSSQSSPLSKKVYGKCCQLHGHTWKVLVKVSGKVNRFGWVMNFKKLQDIVNQHAIQHLDHKLLNDVIPLPTAENIATWIYEQLYQPINDCQCELKSVTVYETEDSVCEYDGN